MGLAVFGNIFPIESRMWASNVGSGLYCLALLACAVASYFMDAVNTMFALTMLALVAMAFFGSLMQSAVIGLAGRMGPKVSAAVMFGFGMSGLTVFALSVIGVLVLDSNYKFSSMVQAATLFVFSGVYTAVSTWVYHFCFSCRIEEVVDVLTTLEEERSNPMLARVRSLQCNAGNLRANDLMQPEHTSQLATFSAAMRQMGSQPFNVWLTFAVTMTVFPSVMHQWAPDRIVFLQLLTGCFQVFDVSGRYLADALASYLPSSRLWMLSILRILFVPAFLLGQWRPQSCFLWGSDTGRVLLVVLLALSHGFIGACAMMYGPSQCDTEIRETAGLSMGCAMVIGIFSGSLLALLTQL
eukprot:CAMPEP_0172813892 /NCGR_PEP_ID=MMETSP1075-20121228/10936_1 /TAXON_ID=2916 /ORGANISM="Ceratium fusus, Strain PA161109" /LENGTH=353 /DNA_ID=CAMNT_0013653645 /DNA_START=327 /DNA_END=1388 /DNA_ORIENTATION=-